MKPIIISLFVAFTCTIGITNKAISQETKKKINSTVLADSVVFKNLINQYAKSIEQADTILASKLWAKTDEVSFIHPRGHEQGWSAVKNNVYGMFRTAFTTKKLNCFNEKVAVYGNVAWVEFYWVFDATFKKNNNPLQTKGRETQIWRKINNEWKLVHIHYSNMPVTAAGQGF
jgi:ketosteroid isomerase-like protein